MHMLREDEPVLCFQQALQLTSVAHAGCNESNIMVYLGLVEQRANELLSLFLQLQHHGHTGNAAWQQGENSAQRDMIGPNTPQVTRNLCRAGVSS